MRRVPSEIFMKMAQHLSPEDRDEMAIPSYTHTNPLMRWMAWHRIEVIAKHLRTMSVAGGDRPQHYIMDFGCGSGVLLGEASDLAERVYGIDVVLSAAEILIKEWDLSNIELVQVEDAETDIPRATLDVIVAGEVLEHIEPLCKTLELFKTWLKPSGTLLVSLPTEGLFYRVGRRLAGFDGHYHKSDAFRINNEILQAGFNLKHLRKIPFSEPFAIYWVIEYCLKS